MKGKFKKKEHKEHGPYGRFVVRGCKIKRSGKKIHLSDVSEATTYWKGENEEKKNAKFEFICPSDEQAESWFESFVYGGAEGQ
jgi:hypothetical protein